MANDDPNNNTPATRQDIERVIEIVRDVETNFLTEFHRYARGQQARMHDVESSEHAMKVRLGALEDRVLELESRLPRN